MAFDDIRLELINNRVDTVERSSRLQQEIADPLKEIAGSQYPSLVQTLQTLESNLEDDSQRRHLAQVAIGEIDDILLELDKVLQRILQLETYNELVDIVRSIIADQSRLIDDTQKQENAQNLELLQ